MARYLGEDEIRQLMDVRSHTGDAPERALAMAKTIRQAIGD